MAGCHFPLERVGNLVWSCRLPASTDAIEACTFAYITLHTFAAMMAAGLEILGLLFTRFWIINSLRAVTMAFSLTTKWTLRSSMYDWLMIGPWEATTLPRLLHQPNHTHDGATYMC